jgi:diguanylate cyclase (GGDEF)-like protein
VSTRIRVRLLLALGTALIAGSVWSVADLQRRTAVTSAGESSVARNLLQSITDQDKALRTFILNGRYDALDLYFSGRYRMEVALEHARGTFRSRRELELVASEERLAREWQKGAVRLIGRVQMAEALYSADPEVVAAARLIDRIRDTNSELEQVLEQDRNARLTSTSRWSVVIAAILTVLFGGLGELVIGRTARGQARRQDERRAYRETQREFTETMQVTRSESEAYLLLTRHLERLLPGANVLVLNRNNSDNRLEAASAVADDVLRARLADAEPQSCLAIRLGRPHEQAPEHEPLLSCELCQGCGDRTTCVPSLVGGEVIGAVNVAHTETFGELQRNRVSESVNQAAPALANLRNLRLAESRAATDALTGLPNNRALYETIKRLTAHANRTLTPLTAIALDVDHFKSINDRYGHEAGDAVLAAVGDCLLSTLRTTDFAARSGGEEFVLLLPDTALDGGVALAEKIRHGMRQIRVPGLEISVTASFGVATIPDDAGEGEGLLRSADRALYVAKANGRDRIEVMRRLALTGALPDEDGPVSHGADSSSRAVSGEHAPDVQPLVG